MIYYNFKKFEIWNSIILLFTCGDGIGGRHLLLLGVQKYYTASSPCNLLTHCVPRMRIKHSCVRCVMSVILRRMRAIVLCILTIVAVPVVAVAIVLVIIMVVVASREDLREDLRALRENLRVVRKGAEVPRNNTHRCAQLCVDLVLVAEFEKARLVVREFRF